MALDTGPFPRAENSKDFQHLNKDEAGHIYGDTPSGTEKHRGADGKSTPINRQLGQPPCSMLRKMESGGGKQSLSSYCSDEQRLQRSTAI
ncbi:hypothetical protein F2Q68_00037575 [Brassica cretica]|uniref:Uncharacterized protein n=1 Tax=Brassica cretica TaxID=69181 RepID=A0A8S9MXF3_BRACR|nr:hypothetical protein F2Q68_00037575 [Brassica cretica]KAF3485124.1 hypothetical protein F2Q69_00057628 [Brassica cretica]